MAPAGLLLGEAEGFPNINIPQTWGSVQKPFVSGSVRRHPCNSRESTGSVTNRGSLPRRAAAARTSPESLNASAARSVRVEMQRGVSSSDVRLSDATTRRLSPGKRGLCFQPWRRPAVSSPERDAVSPACLSQLPCDLQPLPFRTLLLPHERGSGGWEGTRACRAPSRGCYG